MRQNSQDSPQDAVPLLRLLIQKLVVVRENYLIVHSSHLILALTVIGRNASAKGIGQTAKRLTERKTGIRTGQSLEHLRGNHYSLSAKKMSDEDINKEEKKKFFINYNLTVFMSLFLFICTIFDEQ